MTPCFFVHRLFWLWNSFLQWLQVFWSQLLSILAWICAPNPNFWHLVLLHNRWLRTKAGVHSALVKTCRQFLLCPAFHKLLSSPLIHWKSFSVTVDFPTVWEFSGCGEPELPTRVCWFLLWFFFLLSYLVVKGFILSFKAFNWKT